MRKIVLAFLALTLTICCAFALVACTKDNPNDKPTNSPNSNVTGSANSGENSDTTGNKPNSGDTGSVNSGENSSTQEHKHALQDHPAKEPTCTEVGWEAYQTCADCDYTTKVEISAKGHKPSEWIEDKAPTCTEKGNKHKECLTCKEKLETEEITAKGHTNSTAVQENKVDATCTADGSYDEVIYCSECNQEISRTKKTLEKCHNFVNDICTKCQLANDTILQYEANETGYSVKGLKEGFSASTNFNLIIPATYNGKPVTSISDYAFNGCTSLTSVTIPANVTSFGSRSFYGCTGLTSITIPNSVTSIGYASFYNCTGLTSVTIPNSVTTLNSSVFEKCTNLTSVVISNSLTIILTYTFKDCTSLTSVTIPDKVTELKTSAFHNCTNLTSVVIPKSLTTIGQYAFKNCGLKNVYYHGTEEQWGQISIHADSNDAVKNATRYYYCEGTPTTNGNYWNYKDGKINAFTYVKPTEGLEYTLNGEGYAVTGIGTAANETEIVIPATYNGKPVTSIGVNAFRNCTGLTSVILPNTITSIGGYAFYGCTGLKSVTIPENVTSIGEFAFKACIGLTSLTIPNSVTSIGTYAFDGCNSLKYNLYDKAWYLGNDTNPYLALIKVTDIYITSCNVNSNTKLIYAHAFSKCNKLTNIAFPNDLIFIGNNAFSACTALANITIPNSVTSIGGYAFYNCTGLTSVTIGNNVASIGDYAFNGCTGLTSITIPESVTSIGYCAFNGCTGLKSVTFMNANGWWRSASTTTSGPEFTTEDLSNTTTAAKYLTITFSKNYWKRS